MAARFGMAAPPPGLGLSMLDRDPPDHTRLRGLVSKAFTPRAVESLRPRIQQIVDELWSPTRPPKGQMDLIEEFAYPLPVRVICEMLGVPVEDHERFKAWGLDIARGPRRDHAAARLRGGPAQHRRPGAPWPTTSASSSPSGGPPRATTCSPPSSRPRRRATS